MNLRAYTKEKPLDSKKTGLNIKKRRQQLQISARDLSKRVGRSSAYITRIECGERSITNKMMRRIEAALK
jgi:transcriptional regulator with XRE-family HTH domain